MKLSPIVLFTILTFSTATKTFQGQNSVEALTNNTAGLQKRGGPKGNLTWELVERRGIIYNDRSQEEPTRRVFKRDFVPTNLTASRVNNSNEYSRRHDLSQTPSPGKWNSTSIATTKQDSPVLKRSNPYANSTQFVSSGTNSTGYNDKRDTIASSSCTTTKNIQKKCHAEGGISLRDCVCVLSGKEYWNSAYECYVSEGNFAISSAAQYKFQFCKYKVSR
ncbi:uncharacterized protein CANTADRAFT_24291 [Suhomyces tanzawaensis NRRL Y-17324]|uniref:Extracellular membrane protein CFEM domain-containing protein n=1 Tax=Suhomyces tanzawaensis NRRL Y-17324 TaxID=984487 RepID=A0A1E4SB62_9ASCO|nr:uncharacterized protein CANTADRAFT_24291 [Suhomyces tanzawaensis NRRL Y-17324]ODV76718.1 hypothetical protein CANTADRAFT_24291 [Suhomyces tanzawaensis NRRL Y-17324]